MNITQELQMLDHFIETIMYKISMVTSPGSETREDFLYDILDHLLEAGRSKNLDYDHWIKFKLSKEELSKCLTSENSFLRDWAKKELEKDE